MHKGIWLSWVRTVDTHSEGSEFSLLSDLHGCVNVSAHSFELSPVPKIQLWNMKNGTVSHLKCL